MIRSIALENFRTHEATRIPLSRFTLLVGDNASGKSSTLEALAFVDEVVRKDRLSFRDTPDLVRSRSAGMVAIRLEGDSAVGDWKLDLSTVSRSGDITLGWKLGEGGAYERSAESLGDNSGQRSGYVDFPPSEILQHLRRTQILQMSIAELQRPSVSDDEHPTIAWNGAGLATALLYLKANNHDSFIRFQDAARAVIPNLEEITFERVKQERKRTELIRVENELVELPRTETHLADRLRLRFTGTEALPAFCASEGTLYALGLLASLHMPKSPHLVLIDDLDKGLHPRAQAELARVIRQVLEIRPELQVVATSHSPYLVDSFSRKEVVVLSRELSTGRIRARRLSDHPDDQAVKTLTTGEFLNASGSDWFGL